MVDQKQQKQRLSWVRPADGVRAVAGSACGEGMRRSEGRGWGRCLGVVALLAAAGCASVPPARVLPAVAIHTPAWGAALAAVAASPVVPGNAVDVLVDGPEIFPAMLAAIASARRTITYEQFLYKPAAISRVLADALAERCRAGVAVHVLIDGWGVRWLPDEYRALLEGAGCRFAIFRPLRLSTLLRWNHRNHRRILVVDGRVGFTGGSGVDTRWLGIADRQDRWRETDARLEGPVVRWLQGAFAEHWLEATGVLLAGEDYYPFLLPAGTVDAQVVGGAPAAGNYSLHTLYLFAIASARRSIAITNQYVVLDERLTAALVAAARRGVLVEILVPARPSNRLVFAAGRASLGPLLEAGVVVHAYEARPLHAKTMVVDSVWATIGSTNLDPRSFALNDELNVVVHDAAVAGLLARLFREDVRGSRRMTYEDWRQRGFWLKTLGLLTIPIRGQL